MELLVGAGYSRVGSDLTANRSGRWTWPKGTEASLRTHMQGWPHHVDTSSMTFQNLILLHDQHHDVIGPVSGAQLHAHH